jgi:hypothetical protein
LPNLSFINKYMFSWDLLSFFIIYPFLFMLIDVIQKFTPITFDYFIHAGSYVLHFWNKTFNITRVNSSHLISLYESINAATYIYRAIIAIVTGSTSNHFVYENC